MALPLSLADLMRTPFSVFRNVTPPDCAGRSQQVRGACRRPNSERAHPLHGLKDNLGGSYMSNCLSSYA